MPNLLVPFATDHQERLHNPETAEKGTAYFCPSCHDPVILRKGEIKTAHFAHKTSDVCNQETILHKTAKLLVQQAVHDWKAGFGPAPLVQRKCQVCGGSTAQPIPDKVEQANLEHPLADGSITDVALMVQGVAAAAVEIRVTHAVDEEKARSLPIPFIELRGTEVLAHPRDWRPATDRFKPLTCGSCQAVHADSQVKLRAFAKENNLELPKAYYRHGLCKCWRCHRRILVFAWPGHRLNDPSPPKAKPIPKSVQYRYSKGIGKYWANTCPHCHSLQGDFFLHARPEGPFFSVPCEEDTPSAFEKDMIYVALQARESGSSKE